MIKSQESRDFDLARELYEENCFGLTENAIIPKSKDKENYKPKTLIDQTLELIDPTPNIYTLFIQFNERFFWNVLLPVEVKWSSKMTSCAGVCTFHPRNRQCVISLSAPLLKLRPRKDLVETLLHEMIHGYLFLTNNNRDRDGHGPEFCKHMDRINKAAGTKITIYHSFHDEVKLYQQHWWRCNGPCQKRAPYFGTVRRAMNRAPGPTDFWWKEHQQTCGGQFIKIKEPENFKARNSKNKGKVNSTLKNNGSVNSMVNWLIKSSPNTMPTSTFKSIKPSSNTQNSQNGLKKLENATNNVHGWGVGGPSSSNDLLSPFDKFKKLGNNTNNVYGWCTSGPNSPSNSKSSPKTTLISTTPRFFSSDTLGGSNTGKSNLLDKFGNNNQHCNSNMNVKVSRKPINMLINKKTEKSTNNHSFENLKFPECPVCSNFILSNEINEHVNSCLITSNKQSTYETNSTKIPVKEQKRKIDMDTFSNKQLKLDSSRIANCPVCNKNFILDDINEHLDECLSNNNKENKAKDDSIISISSDSGSDLSPSIIVESKVTDPVSKSQINKTLKTDSFKCLVCNMFIPFEMSLSDHLEDCIGSVFNDDSIDLTTCDDEETSKIISEISFDKTDKYPCPVCMELISESSMNQHLDACLKST